ncbi:unnamed protein product [Auanema sp. JU1783]|nr:unnamed protein product [Auanema sp. JU1783]
MSVWQLTLVLALLIPCGVCQFLNSLSLAPSDTSTGDKSWTKEAIRRLWVERKKMGHTPLFRYKYPAQPNVEILFKNESASMTGSLKHRYAWMLMMWALMEGHVTQGRTVYEASSGNTAASLGYMCRLIGSNFTVIVPETIEAVKQQHIEEFGTTVVKVPISQRLERAREEAETNNGFFMNQFGNADKAEDYHETGDYQLESLNMFHEILSQMHDDPAQIVKVPHYFIHTAGTGGTISSIGRYIKKYGLNTKVVFADTQYSVYYDVVVNERFTNESGAHLWISPGMAGFGYGPMGPAQKGKTSSLDPAVIDRALKVPDLASTAAMKVLRDQGIEGGTSSGINFISALHVAATNKGNRTVTITTILSDPAYYYDATYYNRDWISKNFKVHGGLRVYDCWVRVIQQALEEPIDPLAVGNEMCQMAIH